MDTDVEQQGQPSQSAQSQRQPEPDQPLPLEGVQTPRKRKSAKHRVPSRHERAGRRAGMPVKPISLSVPSSVATAWRERSQARKRSLVDVMLDAITAHKDDLAALVRARQAEARQTSMPVSDGLFLRSPASQVSDKADSAAEMSEPDPFVTVPLRMLSTNVDTLDALAFETAAESRSQLVVAALSVYLTAADSPGQGDLLTG